MIASMIDPPPDASRTASDPGVLRRLEDGLRAAMAVGRERRAAAGFELFLFTDSDDDLLSMALPAPGARPPWDASIAALLAAYAPSGRRPRLEIFDELHPELAPALEAAGFVQTMRAPVMALLPGGLVADAGAVAGYRRLRHDDPATVEAFLRAQSVAYGGSGEGEGALVWFASLLAGLEGGTVMAACLEREGRPVSGATLVFGGPIAELAGVWTEPQQRRRGLAALVCRRLLADAFATGLELCWLSAAEAGLGVYRKLGFERVGTQLNYALP